MATMQEEAARATARWLQGMHAMATPTPLRSNSPTAWLEDTGELSAAATLFSAPKTACVGPKSNMMKTCFDFNLG